MRNANKRQWAAKRVTKGHRQDNTVERATCNNNNYLIIGFVYCFLFLD